MEEIKIEKEKKKINWYRVYIVLTLFIILTSIVSSNTLTVTEWEYKVVTYRPIDNISRDGEPAFKYTTIHPNESELYGFGVAGWELVTSYLEMETAYPNFGAQDYVTGIQPNVRPQKLVLIFKRPITS